ncbi:MAG TPA: hypothetical protein VIY86_14370, partial [Pirellulaceae bacterium]
MPSSTTNACVVTSGEESPPAKNPLVWSQELADEIAVKNAELESATPQEILIWADQRFAPRLTMATAFGPEGMVLIHWLASIAPATHIFNLETGY